MNNLCMWTEWFYLAFVTGILGSLHCIGMCGPIALSVGFFHESSSRKLAALLLYNAGRIVSYAALGALSGMAGSIFIFAGAQRWLSLVSGFFILLTLMLTAYPKRFPLLSLSRYFFPVRLFSRLVNSSSVHSRFLMGLLNGLLPCGLVYTTLLMAMSFGNAFQSAIYMSLFGMGTMPVLLFLSTAGSSLCIRRSYHFKKIITAYSVGLALLLILRGLNIGIPYLSPKTEFGNSSCCITKENNRSVKCH
ncbi:MAG: sulfite exporter TauE/SafE family protein [Cytophagaceae bacterium]|nr:sulfite exporter TauE/SafE family protein [Cytophagaceae bacterium]MDW8456133.1 sulfite exporter TauE/SafE family protein [Cytophagaceae bacterium]